MWAALFLKTLFWHQNQDQSGSKLNFKKSIRIIFWGKYLSNHSVKEEGYALLQFLLSCTVTLVDRKSDHCFVCLFGYLLFVCLFVWLILCLAGPDLSIDGRPPARDISHHLPDDSVAHFLVEAIFSNNFSLSLACVARCSGSLLIRALPWGVLFWHKYPPPPSLVVSVLSPHE